MVYAAGDDIIPHMKNIVLGVLAHVDSGKTTLSEALLYRSGRIRSLGRVDHKNAFLDTDRLERERGITIFSKQAVFDMGGLRVYLQDTPGHADFSAEMERTLSSLDYALLIISGPDGLQAHSETLIELLRRHRIPFFVWINKMDICLRSRAEIMEELKAKLGSAAVDFSAPEAEIFESAATCSEEALDKYLAEGRLGDEELAKLIKNRKLFPCFFGSALKLDGVDELIEAMERLTIPPEYPEEFGARVIKITHDEQGNRLSWLKISGGSLEIRQDVEYEYGGETVREKITQIREYSGTRFETLKRAEAGAVCAVLGLSASRAGQGLGYESDAEDPVLVPALSYSISVPGMDPAEAYRRLSPLSEEDPTLRIVWDPRLREIQARLMGEVQIEVLQELIKDRFGLDAEIGAGRILYRETIASPVEGVGHFEPLRHYAEVHLLLEPLPAGSGIIYESAVSTDDLDLNWQRLIIGNLMEKTHVGVLTGSPLTDVKVTLVAGRNHLKHTEGGDMRQAACRALRQGLMKAENVLLEPWYEFTLQVPGEHVGRAIYDIKAMHASFEGPEEIAGSMLLRGRAPVSEMRDYQTVMMSYTKGKGRLSCLFCGYFPCHDTERVIAETAYDPERDVENTPDSVFCSHGSGIIVKWDAVERFMHLDSGIRLDSGEAGSAAKPKLRSGSLDFDEKALEAIIQKEFGPPKRPSYSSVTYEYGKPGKSKSGPAKKEYLIVDGYNIIYAWEELKKLADADVGAARDSLAEILINYRSLRGCELMLIFDGYRRPGPGGTEDAGGIHILYTKERESADLYIERLVHEMRKDYSISVVSSDAMIQLAALRQGVKRMSSREMRAEVELADAQISGIIAAHSPGRIRLGDVARINKKE